MFEMTAMMILDPIAPGCPVHQIKCADQFKGLFDPRRPMTEETGRAMAEWARGHGDTQAQKAAMDSAREVARKGREAFLAWWATVDRAGRDKLHPIIEELRGIAAEADEAAKAGDDNPFGLPPAPTQDQIDAAEAREIAAEAARKAAST